MNLKNKLQTWVADGFITRDQADKIWAKEESTPGKSWVIDGIAGIGVTAFITGVISVIAANWDAISVSVKLGTYFAAQAALGGVFVLKNREEGLVREVSATLFGLLILAGIGLVGQIYNLHSDGWQAILFWLALILPITLLTQSRFLNHVWFVGLGIALFIWVVSGTHSRLREEDRFTIAVAVAFFAASVGFCPQSRWTIPTKFTEAALCWSLFAMLFIVTPVVNFILADNHSTVSYHGYGLIMEAIGVLLCSFFIFRKPGYSKPLKLSLCGMLVVIFSYVTLAVYLSGGHKIPGCAGFILIWSFAAAAAARSKHKRLYDLVTIAIAIRFIVVYFEVFGSLAATGVGLMLSGVVILAIAFCWHRFRKQIARWLEARS